MSRPESGHFAARALWREALRDCNRTGTYFAPPAGGAPARRRRPRVDGWGALFMAGLCGLVVGVILTTGWWTDNVDRIVAREAASRGRLAGSAAPSAPPVRFVP